MTHAGAIMKNPRRCGPVAIAICKRLRELRVADAVFSKTGSGHFKVEFEFLGETVSQKFAGTPRSATIAANISINELNKKLSQVTSRDAMRQKIDGLRTAAGGWKRADLEALGVPWPPPKGWQEALVRHAGESAS